MKRRAALLFPARLTRYLAIVESVANRPTCPRWNADSFFGRFAQP